MLLNKFIIFFALVLGLSLFPVTSANALIGASAKEEACKGAEVSNSAGDDCGDEAAKDTQTIIKRVIDILTIVGGIIAVIVIIVNGIRLTLSSGDSSRVNTARSGIIMAIVGLIIIAIAQALVKFIINKVA